MLRNKEDKKKKKRKKQGRQKYVQHVKQVFLKVKRQWGRSSI